MLLILVGVSIAILTGDNGILKKASNAKVTTEEAKVRELAQTDVLECQIENKDGKITVKQLQGVLKKYFEGVPEEVNDLEEKLKDSNYSLKAKKEYGGESIEVKVASIYDGKLGKGK